MRKIGKELFYFSKINENVALGGIVSPILLLFYYYFWPKTKVGRKSSVEKVLPYQTFLREGIPTVTTEQWAIIGSCLFT
jgi:hypothetical protein